MRSLSAETLLECGEVGNYYLEDSHQEPLINLGKQLREELPILIDSGANCSCLTLPLLSTYNIYSFQGAKGKGLESLY